MPILIIKIITNYHLKKQQKLNALAVNTKSIKKTTIKKTPIVKNKPIKKNRIKKIKTIKIKQKKYMSLNININEDTTINDAIINLPTQIPKYNISLNINMNDNWLDYDDTHDYYKDIQLFYENQ